SGNRSDRDWEVVEQLMQVVLTLPAVLIRRFSGNYVILTEIVLINKATTCLGGALSLCSRRTRCSQQSRILTTTGQCWVASGHWFPLESDKSNGDWTALDSALFAQRIFHAGLSQTVRKVAHCLIVFEISLGNPALDLLAFDDEAAFNLWVWLNREV